MVATTQDVDTQEVAEPVVTEKSVMDLVEASQRVILQRIAELTPKATNAAVIRELAQAYALLRSGTPSGGVF
jgi:hypothetical protein